MKEWILRYWIEAVLSLVSTGLGLRFKSIAKKYKKSKEIFDKNSEDIILIKSAVAAILATSITSSYDLCTEKGFCSVNMLRSITTEYNFYKDFSGSSTNSIVTTLYDEIVDLPHHKAGRSSKEDD